MTPFVQAVIAVAACVSAAGTLFRAWIALLDRRDKRREQEQLKGWLNG